MAKSIAEANRDFLMSALERNYAMPSTAITQAGQVLDIELDSVPGWAHTIDLSCYLDLKVTAGATPTAPSVSQFAPWNIFSEIQVSLGGGPFQRCNPYFHYLRETVMEAAAGPDYSFKTVSYASQVYNVPQPSVTASASTDTYWRFNVKIPLQNQYGSAFGLIPMGNASTKVKLRLTVAPSLYGTDQYQNALYGGTNITSVAVGTAATSYVQPNIWYYTTPQSKGDIIDPTVGYILNVQEKSTPLTTAGANIVVKHADPFKYLRVWNILIDSTGAPIDPSNVSNLEFDLLPGYPQYQYGTAGAIQNYLQKIRRKYATDLPKGVYVFDLFSGSDPLNPNGTQMVDGSYYQTLQSQIAVPGSFGNIGSNARIVSFAETLSPVAF